MCVTRSRFKENTHDVKNNAVRFAVTEYIHVGCLTLHRKSVKAHAVTKTVEFSRAGCAVGHFVFYLTKPSGVTQFTYVGNTTQTAVQCLGLALRGRNLT